MRARGSNELFIMDPASGEPVLGYYPIKVVADEKSGAYRVAHVGNRVTAIFENPEDLANALATHFGKAGVEPERIARARNVALGVHVA